MDSDWVVDQTRLYLIDPLREHSRREGLAFYVSGDSFVYFDPALPPVGPDFYAVRGGHQRGQTKWVAWEEGWFLPTTVIEFLSSSTEGRDRGEKLCLYRDALQVEDYVLVDQECLRIEVYHLIGGQYVSQHPEDDGWYKLPSLQLELGLHREPGDSGDWLRLRTPDGVLLQTGREQAAQERARAEQDRARVEQLEAENRRLLDELRRLRGEL